MNERVPAVAPPTPPETGASMNVTPFFVASFSMCFVTAGSIVLQSIKSDDEPFRIEFNRPASLR
jgi:hypothetical protein